MRRSQNWVVAAAVVAAVCLLLHGRRRMDTTKGEQPFRSKWGLYGTSRGVGGRKLGDQILRHKNIYVRKVQETPSPSP